jgi:hypothetical protein
MDDWVNFSDFILENGSCLSETFQDIIYKTHFNDIKSFQNCIVQMLMYSSVKQKFIENKIQENVLKENSNNGLQLLTSRLIIELCQADIESLPIPENLKKLLYKTGFDQIDFCDLL